MSKSKQAADFFARLSSDEGDFIARMIEDEMDPELIEMFNAFGDQLKAGGMDDKKFRSSLLIIGYLVRAHEDAEAKGALIFDEAIPVGGFLH